ncbi:MAG: pyruvate kinase [Bacilli bacterium]
MKQTKILATLGPSSYEKKIFVELVKAGLNCARLNFSHGDYDFHKRNIEMIREVNEEMGVNIGILLDTKGPEIRMHNFKNGEEYLDIGDVVTICMDEVEGTKERFSITYSNLVNDIEIGSRILIDDGLIALKVIKIKQGEIVCKVLNAGIIKNKKGINVPDCNLSMDFISKKDYEDIKFAAEMDVDFIAASFTRRREDILEIKSLLKEFGNENILIIPKIENQEGLDNLTQIIKVSDGIMVARGDLGVEIPLERVPMAQKKIIRECNKFGKISITATHLLDSMQKNPRPTRAESTDVANAILDGSDAIMLSGETAAGLYPIDSVKVMATIAEYSEADNFNHNRILNNQWDAVEDNVTGAIAISVANSALKLECKAVCAFTASGYTARNISRFRLPMPIIASTPFKKTCTQLSLSWGVHPVLSKFSQGTDEIVKISKQLIKSSINILIGDTYIITAGIPIAKTKHTNFMKIEQYKGEEDE